MNLPTRKGIKIIDQVIRNIPNKILYSNVLSCPSISDHDAPYIIAKMPIIKYQPRCKFIRYMKNFDLQKYIDDFKLLPFSIMYRFYNAGDQLDTLKKIILEWIERHAPLKRKKFTRSPAPWMKDLDIVLLQNQRNKLRYEAHLKMPRSTWVAYRKVRSEIRQKINTTKTSFYKNILNSKNTKIIWKVIHRILNPKSTTLERNVNDINKLFNSTAERGTDK